MGEGTGSKHLDFPVEEVTYEDVLKRFKHLYIQEGLPIKATTNVRWFASEVAVGALIKVSAKKGRIKGTATLPEWRGMGYGEAILWRLIEEAKLEALDTKTQIEEHAKKEAERKGRERKVERRKWKAS
jgi:GNAT superfamily N-acetyltransferase